MTPSLLRSFSEQPLPPSLRPQDPVCDGTRVCTDNLRLRQEYIDALGEFNAAASLHGILARAGAQRAMSEQSWRKLQDGCVRSRRAWARYRQHVAAHGCKRA